jgi:hypothetical protein
MEKIGRAVTSRTMSWARQEALTGKLKRREYSARYTRRC